MAVCCVEGMTRDGNCSGSLVVQNYLLMNSSVPVWDLQEVGGGCEDWMELAQDRDRWRALVSTAMNLRVPTMRGIS